MELKTQHGKALIPDYQSGEIRDPAPTTRMQLGMVKQKNLVSIIVNNYNYGLFLKQAVDSALAQTWPDSEVIVVDDGSRDNSRDIIRAYGDRIRPIFKENGGQASALNVGFTCAHGDTIIFLDSDDVLLPDTAARVVAAFRADPDAAKVQYRMEVIDARGHQTGLIMPAKHLPFPSGDLRPYVLAFPFDLTWMAMSGNAFPASVLRQILPIPEQEYPILADYYLAHLTPLFGPVIALERVGAYYRIHGGNQFAPASPTLDLRHIRQLVTYANRTQVHIRERALQLGLVQAGRASDDMLSVSLLANRLISIKLEPTTHPIPGDRVRLIARSGIKAAFRRSDLTFPFRLLLATWFVVMAISPKPLAYWLAERFFFPETRGQFNLLLGALHRAGPLRD